MTHRRAVELLTSAGLPFPAVVPAGEEQGLWRVYSVDNLLGEGLTIGDAMEAAKDYWLDAVRPPPFIAEEKNIVRAGAVEATAKSKTMAMRIANALNLYNPDARSK